MENSIKFRRFGTMVDCSRNAVMTLDTLKKWTDITASMGYNTLLLYIEDTYEVDDNPYFGYKRGKYSKSELCEIDSYAKEKGVIVCNAGSYSTNAVAQQTFAYILNHYSAINRYDTLVKEGGWITAPTFSMLRYPTDELTDKTIGIIGFGSIGKRVANIARAFDMKVLCFTRTKKSAKGVTFVDLNTLLSKSDIVTAHCPLNEQSRKMFNEDTFKKMKKGAYFVNTARGGIMDENALFEALEQGHLSGAAIDVLETEPMDENCPLIKAKNITITPHTAWAPHTTRQRLLDIVTDNIDAFLEGNPKNVVNK